MISIIVKFHVTADSADAFPSITREFTEATRAEPGNKWFQWSRNVEDPQEYVLIEAFDDDAAEAHVSSDHFAKGLEAMRPHLVETPKILSRQIEGDDWDLMGELQIDQ
ncbi:MULTISPECIES: putative quinol monooxygenase [Micrococcales]|uniref:putative quinol monooxygenase n=1 Tax=Micrococcales TaxID=85006 RepID=UPI0004A9DDFE|nr:MULTISPECIES: putative quinol monooxygenase [Micrococcales]